MNVSFKGCGELTYNEYLDQMIAAETVSLKGLKPDAKVFDEMIMDVNTEYFEKNGGYDFACRFYEEAFRFAEKIYGKDNIISAVMHADELNVAMTEKYGRPIYHYHLHIMALPVVDKEVRWSKRCKSPELVGTVKEVIHQVSHSKKWRSEKALDEDGTAKGNKFITLPTVFCKTNFMSICRVQALTVLAVESVAAPLKISPRLNTKLSRIKSGCPICKRKLPMCRCVMMTRKPLQ